MFEITKEFAFEAAHHLPQMPDGHQCKRPHGHSYRVRVTLASNSLDEATGFVLDFGALSEIKRDIDETLDHQDLAVLFGGEQTTAERLALRLFHRWRHFYPLITAVTVMETAKTTATYRPAYTAGHSR